MPVDTPATGTWTVPAGVTSIDILVIGGGAEYNANGNNSSVSLNVGGTSIIATNPAKAGNSGVTPGSGGSASGIGISFFYSGGQGGLGDGSYGGGGGGGAGSGGAGSGGSPANSGGQIGGAGGAGGVSGNGFSYTGGAGGQGVPTVKGGFGIGAGGNYGGGGGGQSGSGTYGGGGGGAGVKLGYAVTPGTVLDIVVAAAGAGGYGAPGIVAISYTSSSTVLPSKATVVNRSIGRSASY